MSPACERSARTWSVLKLVISTGTTSPPSSLKAFKLLGGSIREKREPKHYEITNVPSMIGASGPGDCGRGNPVMTRYERITFEKAQDQRPPASLWLHSYALVIRCSKSTIDLMIERNRDLLKRGAVLVDETDMGQEVRTLV